MFPGVSNFEKVGKTAGPGPQFFPRTDPGADLEEVQRRMQLRTTEAVDDAPATSHRAATIAQRRELQQKRSQYENANSGFYVVNFANEQFINKCMVPNFEVLEFVRASSSSDADMKTAHAAAERVCERFLKDPHVTSVPVIIPANRPALIAHSVASMQDPEHVLPKIERNIARHNRFTELTKQEYELHTKHRIPGFTKASQYHRHKVYLATKRTLSFGEKAADEVRASDALRKYALEGRQALASLEEYVLSKTQELESKEDAVPVLEDDDNEHNDVVGGTGEIEQHPSHPRAAAPGDGEEQENTLATTEQTTPASSFLETVFQNTNAAPPPVVKDTSTLDLSKWSSDGKDTTTVTIETGLPSHLKASGNYFNFVMYEDLDSPEDSTAYPDAAGMEWIVCLFGGLFTDSETALKVNEEQIAPWAGDVVINTVQANEWLFPTEVDDDQVPQKQRTVDASMQKEFNLIDKQRLNNLSQVRTARELMSTGAVTMRETVIGDTHELPEDDEVVAQEREPVRIVATEEDGKEAASSDVLPDV